jgi:hypothetical protein
MRFIKDNKKRRWSKDAKSPGCAGRVYNGSYDDHGMFARLIFSTWIELKNYRITLEEFESQQTYQNM